MKVLTFGEVMLRLKTPEHLKILQADTFEANYGGAEANVAVSLATLGDDVSYVTKVPEHQVGLENALALCREKKIQVVCDLNYRGKMWSTKDAQRVMRRLMAYVDVCIANDEDFESSLGIPAYDGDMSRGIEQIESYKEGMLEIQKQFPNCKAVASVLRNLYTVEDGDWLGIYLKDGKFYESPVHKVHSFEAVGAGDAFGAGSSTMPMWRAKQRSSRS